MKNLLFTTLHRGIFVGQFPDDFNPAQREYTNIARCRMVIRHRTGKGVQGVAAEGPSPNCLLSAETFAPYIPDITGVFEISDIAADKIWPNE